MLSQGVAADFERGGRGQGQVLSGTLFSTTPFSQALAALQKSGSRCIGLRCLSESVEEGRELPGLFAAPVLQSVSTGLRMNEGTQ